MQDSFGYTPVALSNMFGFRLGIRLEVSSVQVHRPSRQISHDPLLHTVAQRIRRLQNAAGGAVAKVATPQAFEAALAAGTEHIVIEEHLDLSQFEASTQLNWTASFHVPETVKTIHVRRLSIPPRCALSDPVPLSATLRSEGALSSVQQAIMKYVGEARHACAAAAAVPCG